MLRELRLRGRKPEEEKSIIYLQCIVLSVYYVFLYTVR